MPETVILLGGGVGPMAGVAAHSRIVEQTLAPEGDRSHPTVYHISRSSAIPDRTEYLLALAEGRDDLLNPGPSMAEIFADAARALREGETAVAGVPCNTFHAPPIFEAFRAELSTRGVAVGFVHMLEETMTLLAARLGGAAGLDVGVLSTTGTRMSRVYDGLLRNAGYRAVYVPEGEQERLHAAIYDREWGIKAASPPSSRAVATVEEMAGRLADAGVAAIIPACTELPLALPGDSFRGLPLVDPVLALARGVVREAAPGKLKPL